VPWGAAFSQGRAWIVDQNRVVLARTPRLPLNPAVSVALEAGGNRLTWAAVARDEGNGAIVVSSYQVWRSSQPYFRPWDAGVTLASSGAATSVLDPVLATPAAPVFYGVRSVAGSGLLSRTSARIGAMAYTLVH
jgi:hypothetical protein